MIVLFIWIKSDDVIGLFIWIKSGYLMGLWVDFLWGYGWIFDEDISRYLMVLLVDI